MNKLKVILISIASLALLNSTGCSNSDKSISPQAPTPKEQQAEQQPETDSTDEDTPQPQGKVCSELENVHQESNPINMEELEEQLKTTGLGGWIHSAVQDQGLFVFTWRSPESFFVNIQLPMVALDPAVKEKLLLLRRHDQVVLKGIFLKNKAPLQHILVQDFKVVNEYTGPEDSYVYEESIPEEVLNNTQLTAKVHIVANGGRVLVVEKGDRVFPVFNSNPELTNCLYRNDKILLNYSVRTSPSRPSHLEVDINNTRPVSVLEQIATGHGEEFELEGSLVMFPQSPQIKFDVYAIRILDSAAGLQRNFTFMSNDIGGVFFPLKDKLEEKWNEFQSSAEYDRNKYINRKIWIKAKGVKNVVSPTQANPQIFIEDINDVEITVL